MTAHPTQTPPPRRAYSISEFCATFGVSRSKTYLLLASGELTAVKLGSKNLIRTEEAERWFNSLTRGNAA
jgi:excisionase family DNA binding protein